MSNAPPAGKVSPGIESRPPVHRAGSPLEVLLAFSRLGLTSFGGPVAHLGYFRADIVARRRWLDEATYADIVALCQFLPGPASSQVAVSLGILRAGLPGGLAAWFGFSMPSALALIAFAYGVTAQGDLSHAAWLHGLKIVAVAVVAQAVWGMARNLCPDRPRASMAIGAALLALAVPTTTGQIIAIALSALIGCRLLRDDSPKPQLSLDIGLDRRVGICALVTFGILLFWSQSLGPGGNQLFQVLGALYRSGSLVFGGGHVVLPLLQRAIVVPDWVTNDAFLAGYGAAQAVPGPLFTFAAYLGAVMGPAPNGLLGGLLCLVAIYLPSFLLLIGILPFWDRLRRQSAVQAALRGVNAAVVGLLLAALYTPVWTSAIGSPRDFGICSLAFLMLALWKVPPWLVVIGGAIVTEMLTIVLP